MNREDWIYLRRMMYHFKQSDQPRIKAEYKRRFLAAYDAEPVEVKKANAGRRAANLFLTNKYEESK
jgi:hypothetical protein